MKNVKPQIFDFLDYRAFLKAMIDFEKAHTDFSYSIFAERAGFQSRAYLRTVVTGKRNLSSEAINKVIVGFGMNLIDGDAFRALVKFNQATKFAEKHHYWELFLKQRPKNKKSLTVDAYNFLAKMSYPILLVLMQQNHIAKNKSELARLTNLNLNEVTEGLKTLIELGAVIEISPEQYQATPHNLKTTDDVPNIAIQKFHDNMLNKAKETLNLDPTLREFQSLMMALNQDEFDYLRKRVRSLIEEVEEKFSGSRPKSEKVYSLNINLIPITSDFIRDEESASQKLENETKENFYERT